jgi:predicted alpha/beta hydrolase family esterase
LDAITSIEDFNAVIVLTNDSDTARNWVEQVGPRLRQANKPLLFVSSSQAEPLILPYYQATPSQVQGLIGGLAGGVAYSRSVGNFQQNGVWDAYSIGVTVSILIIIIGSIAGGVMKSIPTDKKKEK